MKSIVKSLLARKAASAVRKYKPTVIAVTGSVGKTSTRSAIAAVLSTKYKVRTTHENYNNEFGLPLAILGEKSPGSSVLGWLSILLKPVAPLPKMLVLEYGADHPGDLEYLCNIAQPDVSVVTAISPVHVEHFGSVEDLIKEKATLVRRVKADGLVVLNTDDARVAAMKADAAASVLSYGLSASADVRAQNLSLRVRADYSFEPRETFSVLSFEIVADGDTQSYALKDRLGPPAVSAALAAATVGRHFGVSLEEMVPAFERIAVIHGRLNPIAGVKGSLLIDDSYNAAPASMSAALDVLAGFVPSEGARRIAVLGPMAELGALTKEEHHKIGEKVAASKIDVLVTVGAETAETEFAAKAGGMTEEHTAHFGTAQEAGRWLDREVKKGDIVLIKGSQSARMEKVVRELMAEPLRSTELLVRQYGKWLES